MGERIDIGIDGGGTGCRIALAMADGTTFEVEGGPANIVTDPAGAEASIRLVLERALRAVGQGLDALRHARICAGLAGGRMPGAADEFAKRLPFLAYVVDDSVTALEGALAGADGTLASLGTGSFFIRKAGKTRHHVGGWGFNLGDEGSAAWAGRQALRYALHVVDGRRAPDPVAEALIAATPPHPVLFARNATPGDFAQLMRVLFDAPQSPLTRDVLADVLAALADGVAAVGHRPGTPLVLTGGLGTRLQHGLPDDLARDLAPPAGRPLDGALRLAKGLP